MSYKLIEGNLSSNEAQSLKIAIICTRFNSFITERHLDGAIDALKRHSIKEENISVIKIPGSFEIGFTLQQIVKKMKCDGVIVLGAIIRGSTPHFDYVASETAKSISHIALKSDIPITFGVLTTDNIEQAIERAGTKMGNKGYDSAVTLLEMIDVSKKI